MTPGETIAYLGSLEARLYDNQFVDFLLSLDEGPRTELNSLRKRTTVLYNQLTNARLEDIASRLEALADDFTSGRRDLDRALDEMQNTAAIAQSLARVVGLAAKVAMAV